MKFFFVIYFFQQTKDKELLFLKYNWLLFVWSKEIFYKNKLVHLP